MTQRVIALLETLATIVEPTSHVSVVPGNHADNLVLACAVDARASFLVTGDRRHLLPLREYEGVHIITSSEFLATLVASEHSE
jgi:uncharacterized protein